MRKAMPGEMEKAANIAVELTAGMMSELAEMLPTTEPSSLAFLSLSCARIWKANENYKPMAAEMFRALADLIEMPTFAALADITKADQPILKRVEDVMRTIAIRGVLENITEGPRQ